MENNTNYWVQYQDEENGITIECVHIEDAVTIKNSLVYQLDVAPEYIEIYYKDTTNTTNKCGFTLRQLI